MTLFDQNGTGKELVCADVSIDLQWFTDQNVSRDKARAASTLLTFPSSSHIEVYTLLSVSKTKVTYLDPKPVEN